jgi:prepilin peptidase CpaA
LENFRAEVMSFADPKVAVVLIVAVAAAICDVRTRRIPNVLTFGAAGLALLYALASHGATGLGLAVAGWLTGAALFFPFFALGGMGAGDVKLLAALAAWLGPLDAVWLAVFAAMAGGVFGVAVALAHGYLRQAFANVWLMFVHWRFFGLRSIAGFTLQDSQAPRLAYAIPILVGAVCTLWRR